MIALRDADGTCGGKAGRLGEALRAGYPVPDGFVVPTAEHARFLATLTEPTSEAVHGAPLPEELASRICSAWEAMGGCPVAVRSSSLGEDGATASFAGQFETRLDIRTSTDLVKAVQACWASAVSARVQAYAAERGEAGAMAVLVQRFVPATAAGVAFTADPVDGDRDVVRVSAVPGVGEALVSGERDGEEWLVRRGEAPSRLPGPVEVLAAEEVQAVVALARRLEAEAGHPVDVEWALHDGEVVLLQSRPMTALPEPVRWDPPPSGAYIRNLRLGEWIGDPVTPLFDTWLLTRMEGRLDEVLRRFGLTPLEPSHVVLNGWYFYRMDDPIPQGVLPKLAFVGRFLWTMISDFRWAAGMLPPIAHLGLERHVTLWRGEVSPRYRAAVDRLDESLPDGDPESLIAGIDAVADAAGDLFVSILVVAGYAAKGELPLRTFFRANLGDAVDFDVLDLLAGLGEHAGPPAAHAVQGLDWSLPTLGELEVDPGDHRERAQRVEARRLAAERACREALTPRLRASFDKLLARAQRGHVLRQEQSAELTLGWPAMRRALRRLGELGVEGGGIAESDDIYFLRRDELEGVLRGDDLRDRVGGRRASWERQRRLVPPLQLGELPADWKAMFDRIEETTGVADAPPGAVVGMPASPGRFTGTVRVLRSVSELDRLKPGEVLVTTVTTPGWTPAFARAGAVVTDSGSLASHASVVAREYGIPAVVATGDATQRLRDGQRVTVDGGRGFVEVQ